MANLNPVELIDNNDFDGESDEVPSTSDESMETGWENEPSVRDLKQDYIDAQSDQEAHINKVELWLDNLNITGAAKIKTEQGRSKVQPMLIRKQAEWRYASLSEPFLSTPDLFNIDPVSFEDKQAAIQNELVINNQFNTKIEKVRFVDEFIRTITNEGTGIARVGWDFEEEEVEVEVPDFQFQPSQDPQIAQLHQELHQMMQANPEKFQSEVPPELQQAHQISMEQGVPIEAIQSGTRTETQTKTVRNEPTIEVCDYRNISIDPTSRGTIGEADFVIYSFESSLSELKKDGKYKNLDEINLETNSILGDPDYYGQDDTSFNFSDKPRKKFIVYEYWGFWDKDSSGKTSPIVASWVGNVMIRLEDNPFPDGENPFVKVQYLPVVRSNYGEPDGELLEDNQKIVGAVTRGMIDIMARSANGQQGSRKDALDLTNKRKFDRGADYEFNQAVDPKQAFHMHTYPEIPQSAGLMLQLQNAEAESLTGVKAFHTGISGEALGTTATGVRSALDATSKRELGILRRITEGFTQIGRKIISMNSVFLSEQEIVRVTNEEFVTIRRDDLEGNFDLRLSISTAEADNQKAEELAFMLQTTAQSMGPEFSQIILTEIARLRKMPTLAKTIKEYQPQPDPLAEKAKELEIAKLEAEIAKLQSEAQENLAEAQLDIAKAGTEGAKAQNLGSDTDQKNLDFVEQETGTKQERELQKQQAQAEAQAKTKVIEAALKPRTDK